MTTIAGRNVTMRALVGRSNVSIAFLRLPDGFPSGSGSSTYSGQSLSKLWTGSIQSIRAVDGSETYTRTGLISTLTVDHDRLPAVGHPHAGLYVACVGRGPLRPPHDGGLRTGGSTCSYATRRTP